MNGGRISAWIRFEHVELDIVCDTPGVLPPPEDSA